jgi:hypothetical protein
VFVELSLAVYEEITGTSPLPPVDSDDDRRKHQRMPFGFRAAIHTTRRGVEGPASVVMVRDISLAGISILHEDFLKNGISFTVEFKGGQDRPVKIRCAVVRCETGGMGGTQYVVGATFEELLTKELPPLPKEEPLPPLSDQSHIRGRLIKANSEFDQKVATAADAIVNSSHQGPAPSGPFSAMPGYEPDQRLTDQAPIHGKLIRPNSEMEKKGALAKVAAAPVIAAPTAAAANSEPVKPLDQARIHDKTSSKEEPAESPSDQSRILGRLAKSDAEIEKKAAPLTADVSSAAVSAKDSAATPVLDEEAEALAMLLSEPEDLSAELSLEDLAGLQAEFSVEASKTSPKDETRIADKPVESEAEAEKKTAAKTEPAAKTELPPKAATKDEPADPPSDEARILGRLTKSDAEVEKKPTPVASPVPALKSEPIAKVTPKDETANPPSERVSILDRLSKSDAEVEKKPAPVAPPVIASKLEPVAKPAPKDEPVTPPSDQARILGRLGKSDVEAEKKPTPVAPPAPTVNSAPVPKATPPDAVADSSDLAKYLDELTKPKSEPETKHVPLVAASEDASAAKPAPAKAQPANAPAPSATIPSIALKTTVSAEQKPNLSSHSPAKGGKEMSIPRNPETHSEQTGVKNDVVAGVKSLLLQQRETLKRQDQEMEALRTELAQVKRKATQLQAKADADQQAMSELENLLATESGEIGPDTNESVAA